MSIACERLARDYDVLSNIEIDATDAFCSQTSKSGSV